MELEGIMTSSISIMAPSLEQRVAVWYGFDGLRLRLLKEPYQKPLSKTASPVEQLGTWGAGALFHEERGATDRGFSRLHLTIAEAKTLLPSSAFSLLGYEATPA
jgi:hypothetical protein